MGSMGGWMKRLNVPRRRKKLNEMAKRRYEKGRRGIKPGEELLDAIEKAKAKGYPPMAGVKVYLAAEKLMEKAIGEDIKARARAMGKAMRVKPPKKKK